MEALALTGVEIIPGSSYTGEALAEAIYATYRYSYHAFGSCKMGTDATNSVVDDHLLVHGFANLRIVDNSVFPSTIRYFFHSFSVPFPHFSWVIKCVVTFQLWTYGDHLHAWL